MNGAITNLTPFYLNMWTAMDGFFGSGSASLHYRPSSAPSGTSYIVTMTDGAQNLSMPSLYPGQFDDMGLFQSMLN